MNSQTSSIYSIEYKTLADYFNMVREHLIAVIGIFIVIFGISVVYAFTSVDIYQAETTLKIAQPQGNILEAPLMPEMLQSGADRFIANEIETMKNITIRKQVAQFIIDTFKTQGQKDKFALIFKKGIFNNNENELKNVRTIAELLKNIVKIEQKKGLDFITVSAESPSPYEASLIVNTYAKVYRDFNLLENRKQITRVKLFLEKQRDEQYKKLVEAENKYKLYQLKGGAIELDEQAKSLIETITDLESKENSVAIEISIAKEKLDQYKAELKRKDKSIANYLESKATEPYLLALQNQIAGLETKRDFALSADTLQKDKTRLINEINDQIARLKQKLRNRTAEYQKALLASSPEEIKQLTQLIFQEEVKYNSLLASYEQIKKHLARYEKRFDALPERTIDLARLERERMSYEKLYLLIEEKYQEALINEQSISGNVLILNEAEVPAVPSKPNRMRIMIIGLILGLATGVGYSVFVENMDKSIKTPDDIEKINVNLLGWIPKIIPKDKNSKIYEFVVASKSDPVASDSFKSLRTMIKYTNVDKESKSFLITSSVPGEGKSLVSLNLAGSFALARKKTVLMDCDLRKPRVHSMFNAKRIPGFTDYIVGKVQYEEIIRDTEIQDLFYISAGTIPPNPTEILDSRGMKSFLNKLRNEFDVVIIDSAPIATIADSIILSRLVDETILVALANFTETEMLQKSVETLQKLENSSFSGVLLNKFNLRKKYGSYYYKYAYQYTKDVVDTN